MIYCCDKHPIRGNQSFMKWEVSFEIVGVRGYRCVVRDYNNKKRI